MSQHIINAKSKKNTVTVGYDRPLNAYFATVHKADKVIEWIPGVQTVGELAECLKPYADLSSELRDILVEEQRDRDNHPMMKLVDHRSAE